MKESPMNAHAQIRSFIMNSVNEEFFFESEEDWKPIEYFLNKKEVKFLLNNINGFICIYNYKKSYYEYVSDNVRSILGYESSLFIGEQGGLNMLVVFDQEQIPYLMSITEEVLNYLAVHSTFETGKDFRHTSCMKFKNIYDEFQWYMTDKSIIQTDNNGFPIRALITCTNINAFKKDDILYYNLLKKDANGVYQPVLQGYMHKKEIGEEEALTKRELQIIKYIAEGYTNVMIAEKLFISLNTVKTHRKHILRKTCCKGTAELTKLAFGRGMV